MYWNGKEIDAQGKKAQININMRCIEIAKIIYTFSIYID